MALLTTQRKPEGCSQVPAALKILQSAHIVTFSHDSEFKDTSVSTQGQVESQLVFSAPWTKRDGLGHWGKL